MVAELQLQIISFIKFTSRIWLLCRSINVVAFSCKISNNIDKLIFLLPMAASIIYFSYWGPSIEYNEGNYWYSQLHIHYPVWILDVLDNNWNAHFQFQKLQKRSGNFFLISPKELFDVRVAIFIWKSCLWNLQLLWW